MTPTNTIVKHTMCNTALAIDWRAVKSVTNTITIDLLVLTITLWFLALAYRTYKQGRALTEHKHK